MLLLLLLYDCSYFVGFKVIEWIYFHSYVYVTRTRRHVIVPIPSIPFTRSPDFQKCMSHLWKHCDTDTAILRCHNKEADFSIISASLPAGRHTEHFTGTDGSVTHSPAPCQSAPAEGPETLPSSQVEIISPEEKVSYQSLHESRLSEMASGLGGGTL